MTNSTRPKSTLKKKCNFICYHAVWESVAMGESLITHICTEHNHSDPMTKTKTTSGAKRRRLVSGILYDIYDDHSQQWRKDQLVTTTWSWGDWRNTPMCTCGLVTGQREWKVSFACRPVVSKGTCQLTSLPEVATLVPLPFPLALDLIIIIRPWLNRGELSSDIPG